MEEIIIEKVDESLPDPFIAHEGDAGIDCFSTIDFELNPGEYSKIPLGIKLQLPKGKAGLILPRSGLSFKDGLITTVGLIDSGYRGEIAMNAKNISNNVLSYSKGTRVCQLLIIDVPEFNIKIGKVENDTKRGLSGFGSSGIF